MKPVPALTPRARRLAVEVLARSDRNRPADTVLRETLRAEHGLSRAEGRLTARAVFAHGRWRGWLDPEAPLAEQVEMACELANRFAAEPAAFADGELAARAVPAWTSTEMEVTPQWLRVIQTEPVVWLRARPGHGTAVAAGLRTAEQAGEGAAADAVCYQGEEDLFRSEAFHRGEFELQDLHSQAVGWLCAPTPGETWWDACAGEGGKTLHLADLMANRGLIWATDRTGWRLQSLRRRAARARIFNYRSAAWNGGGKLPTRTRFDGVLVDAPCSNVGTWQRNPHARWTTGVEDVHALAERQIALLHHVAPSLKPAGRLIYAVCTLTRVETDDVVSTFGREHPEFAPLPLADPLVPDSPPVHGLWLRPGPRLANGMFVAAWRRRSS